MRGFAQTVHCPRCGTPKPTGAESVPIVTCGTCGLGFDPKPREQQPSHEQALAVVEQSLVHEEVADTDALLVFRESVFGGVWLVLLSLAFGALAYLASGIGEYGYVVVLAAVSALVLYGGIGRMLNHTLVYVSRDMISAWQRPLPRHRERFIGGEVWSIALVPRDEAAGRTYDLVATEASGDRRALRLVNVPHGELANELEQAIRKHRARLGAPVLSPEEDDQAVARVVRRET
jgi:hypothetical protein